MENFRHVRIELMRPGQLREALAARSVVFLPIGTIEYHQEHLPLGLDALNAHGLTCLAASRFGGAVLPPLYFGTGGSHKEYPWTIMMASESEIRSEIETALRRIQDHDVEVAVIFTGHFAPEQVLMIEEIAKDWRAGGNKLKVISLAINMELPGAPRPDHAGIFETTVLSYFEPMTIDLSQLPSLESAPSVDPDGDQYGLHRHDPSHPLWGVFGADPRNYNSKDAEGLVIKLAEAIEVSVQKALN